jgi:hypothetical protein
MSAWSSGPLRALVYAAAAASPAWSLAIAPAPAPVEQPAARVESDDVKKELDELVSAYTAENEAYMTASGELRTKLNAEKDEAKKKELSEQMQALAKTAPGPKYVERFEALAKKAKGGEVALEAWIRVVQLDRAQQSNADRPAARALAALVSDHIDSERLGEVVGAVAATQSHEATIETLKKLRAKSPHRPVQAAALLALAGELEGRRAVESDKGQSKPVYTELSKDFGDLSDSRGRKYSQIADAYLFEYDHLQVGMAAPDFEAIDENGVKFKLSDYRGKVVMLDFWGIW